MNDKVTHKEKEVLRELIESAEQIISACYTEGASKQEDEEPGSSVNFFVHFTSGRASIRFSRWYPCDYTHAVKRLRDDIEEAFEIRYLTFLNEHGGRVYLNMNSVEQIEI